MLKLVQSQSTSYGYYYSDELPSQQQNYIPLHGRRAGCGLFGISDDFIEEYQSLDTKFIKNKASTFYFRASGSSMEPLIFSGDTLVVDRSIGYFHNRICIVIYEDQLICKRVLLGRRSARLVSENPDFLPIDINESLDAVVWGVVIARISHL